MIRADRINFFAACDALKKDYACHTGNLFLNSAELASKFENESCHFHRGDKSIFLLLPSHGDMQSLHFLTAGPDALASDLPAFLRQAFPLPDLKTSIIGPEDLCDSIYPVMEANGFVTIKKLISMRLAKPQEKIIAAMRVLADNYIEFASFAEENDAEEILDILCEEFDIVGDNIPRVEEIRENIKRKNVTIIRMNGKIATLHYFQVEKGIAHGYFDMTRKEFRGGNGLIFALNIFEHEYFKKAGIRINRSYGWREEIKTRLVKSSSRSSSFPDGIVIYNMLHKSKPGYKISDAKLS